MTTTTDPTTTPPTRDEGYEATVQEMVTDFAPRRFAVFQDWGDHVDGWIAAWGIAFDGRVEVIDVDGGTYMSLRTPDLALLGYSQPPDITARLVWIDPEPQPDAE